MLLRLLLVLLACAPAASAGQDPDLALGLRQVSEGDFESAVPTLQAVAQKLEGDGTRAAERAQALLHLGVAQVAIDRGPDARLSFQAALAANPQLRPTTADFSPKVVQAFEAARAEMKAQASPAPRRSRAGWIAGGVGAAAAGVALAARGGGEEGGEATVTLVNARFGTPVLVCPDWTQSAPLPFTIVVEADATASTPITSVTATVIIVASAQPGEVNFASSQPATAAPARLAAGRTTVTVSSTLTCGNGLGDAPRFNEWTGRVTLTTPSGTTTAATVDRMRINVP